MVTANEHMDILETRALSGVGTLQQRFLNLTGVCFFLALFLSWAVVEVPAASLKPGDLLVADSAGAILHIDAASGTKAVLSAGGNLTQPFGLAMDPQGNVLASDTGSSCIVRINPATGAQTIVTAGGHMGSPYGIAADRQGNIFVANGQAVISLSIPLGKHSKSCQREVPSSFRWELRWGRPEISS